MSEVRAIPPTGTFRTWICYVVAATLLVLGVEVRSPVPLFAAVALLLAPVAALLFAPPSPTEIPVTWEAGGGSGTVRIRGRIATDGRINPRDLEVEFTIPPGLSETAPPQMEYDAGGIDFTLSWEAREPFLASTFLPTVRWMDPLGLIQRTLRVRGTPLFLERYPPEIGRMGTVRLHRTVVRPGETRSAAIGDNGGFYGVRAAIAGDPPRRINWAATARTGTRWVNEFNLERTGDVLILLDARPTDLGPVSDERLLGVSRAATLGLTEAFLREKARVGLAIFGEFVGVVPLGSGRSQHQRIRRLLLETPTSEIAGPPERGAISVGRHFRPGLTTILISPLADEAAGHFVVHLRRRGFRTVVLSPSPLTLAPTSSLQPHDRASVMEDLAIRIDRLARRNRIAETWRDAPVVDWTNFWSLGEFAHFLHRGLGAQRRS